MKEIISLTGADLSYDSRVTFTTKFPLVGLLPNETKWLDFMVDFNKGCFLRPRASFPGQSLEEGLEDFYISNNRFSGIL